MKWWEVRVTIAAEAADAVSALFQEWPEVQGVSLEGALVKTPPHPNYGEWFDDAILMGADTTAAIYLPEYVQETSIAPRVKDVLDSVAAAGLHVGPGMDSYRLAQVDEESWEHAWKQDFHPMPVGDKLIIVPRWTEAASAEVSSGGRLPILLEPGMAFGTGTHATTRMCLVALERIRTRGASAVLDVGCGTGILAIAAAKLGAESVTAIDIDPVAVHVATDNVRENGVQTVVRVQAGDLLQGVHEGIYDIAVANILRDVVIALTPQVAQHLRLGGYYVVSGIITNQEEAVARALAAAGFEIVERLVEDDWVALIGERTR